MSILIKNAQVLPMTAEEIICGDILIAGDKIAAIGVVDPALISGEEKIINAEGHLAMPGLINAHTHAAMTLLRSYADDLELMSWLNDEIWPAEDKMGAEDIYWGTMLAIAEMIRGGTTTFADMYGPFMEKVAQAVTESGIRASLARGCVGVSDPNEQKIAENIALYEEYNNSADGRIKVWFGPHAPYTCSSAYLEKLAQAAWDHHSGIHVHLSETTDELRQIRENYTLSPVEYLAKVGIFDGPCLAAHGVWLNDEEIAYLAERKVSVVHNAVSNMKLSSGAAPVAKMLKMGLNVGLGTDGASSNNSLDMFKEMSTAAYLSKLATMEPTSVKAFEALQMATIGSARALGWDKEIGTLEVGKKADLILVDLIAPHFCPWNNSIADLVYSAKSTDVTHTIVNGKLLMENRELLTLDLPLIMKNAQKCAKRITTK